MSNQPSEGQSGFLGSRLHVALCLVWMLAAQVATYVFNGDFSILNILAIPIGLASLALTHVLLIALRYVATGKGVDL